MIKISNGTKKGFKLKVPTTGHVRPKTGKTRKMIFDVLQSVDNYKILDLFAGCGSLGIEALSMGANFVTFIDSSPISIKYIKENLKKCTFEDSSDVQKKDFSVATRELMRKDVKFDLIFIDPPYDYFDEKSLNGIIRSALKLCKSEGIIVCEHPMYEKLKLDVINYKVKQYKDKFITFCTKK